MKIKTYIRFFILAAAGVMAMTSCLGDLDTIPLDEDVTTAATVYDDPAVYRQVLAKCYAILAVSGQGGPHGMPDITGIDEGFSNYVRQYWKAQELTTDEAMITWADGTIQDYHEQDWSSASEFITATYNRIYYMISITNELIRETSVEKLDERGVAENMRSDIAFYRAEARFLRAMAYWHAIDLFGNVPFVTEDDSPGSFFPERITRSDLFDYIETELLEIENLLAEPTANEYGRVDKAAAWTLLAKLYLNSEVYINTAHYDEAVTYCNKVISSGYTLHPVYEELFMADNHLADGIIFPVTFDGVHTRTWGGMTFLVHAAVGGNMVAADYGVDGGWNGLRMTKEAVSKFIDISGLKKSTKSVSAIKSVSDYPVIYVPGGHQDWDPATAPTLGSVNSDDTYEGYIWFDAGTEFKFTEGPNWDVDWGDDDADGTLNSGGANIVAADAGYYKINVDLNDNSYTMTATSWGMIGDATPGGWDTDTDMTYDAATDSWSAVITLSANSFKFRANDDWAIDLGDTGADAVLDYGGDNISVSSPSTYLVTLFLGSPDYTYTMVPYANDGRNAIFSDGQSLEIDDNSDFQQGYAFPKFTNITSGGEAGADLRFPDTDFLMFRLADVYLMYAEAVLRGGSGGDAATALTYINALRERAYGGITGNIDSDELDLDFILDERVRELMWEGHRRTDLIRYGRFSDTDYLWAWKGGVKEGRSVDSKYDLFPIPSSDMGANPNLVQNPGY